MAGAGSTMTSSATRERSVRYSGGRPGRPPTAALAARVADRMRQPGEFTCIDVYPRGLRPSDSLTRSLARRFVGALRSRGSLARLARIFDPALGFVRQLPVAPAALTSHAERLLLGERRRGPEREEIRGLRRRHAGFDCGVEFRIRPLVSAAVPHLQELFGEGAVMCAVHRGLVVLAAGNQNHRRATGGADVR